MIPIVIPAKAGSRLFLPARNMPEYGCVRDNDSCRHSCRVAAFGDDDGGSGRRHPVNFVNFGTRRPRGTP